MVWAIPALAQDAPPGSGAPPPTVPAEPGPEPGAGPLLPPLPAHDEPGDVPAGEADEITVVGTIVARTPGSAHVIGSEQLERFEYDDPQAALAPVPGVYARGEDGVGLRPNIGLRGVNPDRSKKVTLLEDGILFGPAPYSAPAAYYFPLITRMTQLRVIKGPAAIGYGPQTVGGAIDFRTAEVPYRTEAMFDLAGGEYGYGKLHGRFGSSGEDAGFLVEGVHLRSDGFKHVPGGGDTGFYRNEWMVKGYYLLEPNATRLHELRLKLTYSDELSNETYLGLTDADFRDDPLQRYAASRLDRMRWHRISGVLSHEIELSRGLSLTTTAYRHDFSRSWRKVNRFRGANLFDVLRDPEQPQNAVFYAVLTGQADSSSPGEALLVGPNQRDFVSQGVESRVDATFETGALSHKLQYGVRLHQDRIERRHSEDAFLVQGGELFPEGSPTIVTAFNEAETEALAMHGSLAVTWKRLTLTPGVRFEVMRSEFIDRAAGTRRARLASVVLPGGGAYYGLTDELGVFAGAYRGFSPPPPGSDDHVDPESSVNYEAGVRFSQRPLRLELIGYYNDYSNLTDVCTLSSGCLDAELDRQFDAGEARIYGLEVYAAHDLPLGAVTLPISVAYTLTRAEFLNDFTSDDPIFGEVEDGDELPYVPRHQLYASLGVAVGPASAALGLTYVSRMREEAGREPLSRALATDEQLVLDATAKYRVIEPVELYVNARNLLDAHDIVSRRPYGARPNAPRLVQVGAKASF